ncbi:MAG: 50S ribosomal protein L29 [bacterium]
MKTEQIREMTVSEIRSQLHDLEEELTNLRFQKVTSQLDNPLRVRMVRRDIARLKTVLHEHEVGIRKLS